MERLQRSTLYKMAENGGKGVPDILNIIRAQQLSNLVKTFNKPDRKASFFERHYATPILRTLGMGTIDHTVPYSWDPPKVYKAIRDFAFGSGLSTAGLASWKYKDIMGHIRSKDRVAPLRASSTVALQQVWLNVNHNCLTNRQKDISWMAVHGCLPTGEFMYRRHIALTVSCPHGCNTVENTYHVLAECSVARRVWALFVPSVSHNRSLTLPRLTIEKILNRPPGGCTTTELRQQWRIIGVVKQVLDHAITDFHKDPVTARASDHPHPPVPEHQSVLEPPAYQPHQCNAPGGMTPPPQPHHPSTERGVEEGLTLDLPPDRRFTGEYHNDPRVGARPVDCSAPQVVLSPLCRSSTSGGPWYPAPKWRMERAAHRRVPLMTFGSGLSCGLARSPVCTSFPLQVQHQNQHQHQTSTPKRRGGGTYTIPSHWAGRSQASSINDPLVRTRLWVGSLLRLSFLPSAGPPPGPDHAPSTNTNTTTTPGGGGEEGRTSDLHTERAAHRRVQSMTFGPGLWVGSLLRLSFLTLCRSSTRP
ncbi:hypothetical protein DPEC_G00017360 [Dallia pectoralis]|uniref:Uncharacterized protein n=1 Tax=Dallia pectoralis TaxID=75939 RepID=A0ACC2HF28_DALPE|nr:hypothetical protein DPEC_G00017360 [Dallia pectoralis]